MDPVHVSDRQPTTLTRLADALAHAADVNPTTMSGTVGEWIDYTASCPCGRVATWYSRAVLVGRPGRPSDHQGARYTRVEYVIDCACNPLQTAAA